jgi:large repetitive protein
MDFRFVRAASVLAAFVVAALVGVMPSIPVAVAQSTCITIVCSGGTGGIYVPPPWSFTGSMSTPRSHYTATLLNNGKVLVAGGIVDTSGTSTSSAELFDLSTGTWTPTGSMSVVRSDHTATLLANGKVLVAGGGNENVNSFPNAEIYDPLTGHWSNTGSMTRAHVFHTATLLPSGQVLVAGGQSLTNDTSVVVATAELYDPARGIWTATGALRGPRSSHAAARINDRVVVAGGTSGNGRFLDTTEVYDSTSGTWSSAGSMSTARMFFTLTALNGPTGKTAPGTAPASICITIVCSGGTVTGVLAAGGWNRQSGWLSTAEVFDPSTRQWHATHPMSALRNEHTATLLRNGMVLIAGGSMQDGDDVSSELYDPSKGGFTGFVPMNSGRSYAAATLLPNGSVLVAGGAALGVGTGPTAEAYAP